MSREVSLGRNKDGTWTARIGSSWFTVTYWNCIQWLRSNGEDI